eukprot:snap_masked-scaffold_20-processed-gene-3.22-mRNA-1 protein AED:0.47 eAED:0.47 QI:0/-1/0/1/-1/1/1/0/811
MSAKTEDSLSATPPNTFGQSALNTSTDSIEGTDGRRNKNRNSRKRTARRSLERLFTIPLTPVEAQVADTQLPVGRKERKLTDMLFLILFVAYWIGMAVISAVAFRSGDPNSLLYGTDSRGRTCGGENLEYSTSRAEDNSLILDLRKFEYVVFPTVEEDAFVASELGISNPLDINFFSICAAECPGENEYVCTPEVETQLQSLEREEVITGCFDQDLQEEICETVLNNCYRSLFNQSSFFFRCFPEYVYKVEQIEEETFCIEEGEPNIFGQTECLKFQDTKKITRIEPTDTNLLFDAYNSFSRVFDQLMSDTMLAGDIILYCGILVTVIAGLGYIVLLRYVVGYVIWGTILLTIAALAALTAYLYARAGVLTDDTIDGVTDVFDQNLSLDFSIDDEIDVSEDHATEFRIAAYVSTGCLIILCLVVFYVRKRVNKAIEFFKHASKAIKSNPAMLLVPFFSVSLSICIIAFCAALILFMYTSSSGEVSSAFEESQLNTLAETFGQNSSLLAERLEQGSLENSGVLLCFVFLGWLWSMQVVFGISFMTVSFVVGDWYWKSGLTSNSTADTLPREQKASCSCLGLSRLWRAFATVMRFHVGTTAFGGLLIAFVQMVRYAAAFIQARTNKLSGKSKVVKILLLSLNCCLKCAENCIKFISHNAYIMTMLYGVSFCQGTKMAFSAFAHNLVQVATVTFLGDIILRFGQLFITVISALAAYTVLSEVDDYQIGGGKELYSVSWCVFLTTLLAWFVSSQVMGIYRTAIDTILLSWCQDNKLQDKKAQRGRNRRRSVGRFVQRNKQKEADVAKQNSLAVYG